MFITDGGFFDRNGVKNFLTAASYLPIFWQFVGVNGYGYWLLEELDNMNGRYVDNANFFALDDFKHVDKKEIYSRLLNEFPDWTKAIKNNGVLDGSARNLRPSSPPPDKSFKDKVKGLFGF